jgi:hypothetical protein
MKTLHALVTFFCISITDAIAAGNGLGEAQIARMVDTAGDRDRRARQPQHEQDEPDQREYVFGEQALRRFEQTTPKELLQ